MPWIGSDLKDHPFPFPLPWIWTPSTSLGCSKQSSLALNTSTLGAATTSLGSLFQCLTTNRVKNFFHVPSINLLPCSYYPLFHTLEKKPLSLFQLNIGLQLFHPKPLYNTLLKGEIKFRNFKIPATVTTIYL